MGLREKVWYALSSDTQIVSLLDGGLVYPNFSVASPANDLNRWIILRWGTTETPPGRDTTARAIPLTVAVYDREPNYKTVERLLTRGRAVLLALEAQSTGDGWVLNVGPPQSSGDDSWDDSYAAVYKTDLYRIVASGGM